MVGTPGQTLTHLVEDLLFIEQFQPQMIGIGPFIPHHDTPFGTEPAGSVGMTLKLLSLFRLMHPSALIPSTTALATLSPDGREKGILAGANVVMPNLSPGSKEKNTPCMITKPLSVPKQPKVYELWHNNWKQSVTGYRQIEVTITNP